MQTNLNPLPRASSDLQPSILGLKRGELSKVTFVLGFLFLYFILQIYQGHVTVVKIVLYHKGDQKGTRQVEMRR